MRHLSEFRHAAGSWRRVVRTGCAAVADVIETVVSAIDRFWARRHEAFDFPGNGPATGSSTPPPWPGGGSQISPATMSALLAAQSQSTAASATTAPIGRSEALKHLFSQLDANGDGQISQSEFESALGAGGTNKIGRASCRERV